MDEETNEKMDEEKNEKKETNPFERSRAERQQNLKERPELPSPEAAATPAGPQVLELKAKERRRQSYTVYLDKDLMGRVRRLAKQKGVASSIVIEACLKMSLEQLEE